MKNILLQTTIPFTRDDWHIGRFSIIAEYLHGLRDEKGGKLFRVTARDRENTGNGDDSILPTLERRDFDQLWLFGVDVGAGLTNNDCAGITAFRKRGGGVLTSRDHEDLGLSFCTLGGVGPANHFHSRNNEPDPARQTVDDTETPAITWPNYHSGKNGDFQQVYPTEPLHEIFRNSANRSGRIEFLPAHPHEGAVSVPQGERAARVIATGKSKLTGREFNLAVAFERNGTGRAVADSSFHHFLDYNFDPAKGCPTFVTEPPGRGMLENRQATSDAFTYVRNLASWLT